jgi:uncharacterized repeat protein (TIGR03803 family)
MRIGDALRAVVLIAAFAIAAGTGTAATPGSGEAPSITEQTLYKFCAQSNCADGGPPNSAGGRLIMDGAGNLYGTTTYGGANSGGTVFQLTPTSTGWSETVLYSFCSQSNCADGYEPNPGLMMDGSGNLYGTTYVGGAVGKGVVFQLTPSGTGWSEKVLYSFCSSILCADGQYPHAGLIMDGSGNLYGTTSGAANTNCVGGGGCGTVYQLIPGSAGSTYAVLHSFCSQSNCADGKFPKGGLIMDGPLWRDRARRRQQRRHGVPADAHQHRMERDGPLQLLRAEQLR